MRNSRGLVCFLGPAGSGKGTQSHILKSRFGFPIVSAGDTLREAAKHDESIRTTLHRGQLNPEHITAKLLCEKLKKYEQNTKIVLLDGYPRSMEQFQLMLEWFKGAAAFDTNSTIFLQLLIENNDKVRERLKGRLIHNASGRTYHKVFRPPLNDEKDDITGEPLGIREDDQCDSAIEQRLRIFREKTIPMIQHIVADKQFIYETISDGSIQEVERNILHTLQRHKLINS